MADIGVLRAQIETHCTSLVDELLLQCGELTLEVSANHLRKLCFMLRDEEIFAFNLLIDVCGVDYLQYGVSEWETTSATGTGFERGAMPAVETPISPPSKRRFASVYHMLSLTHNWRLRIKVWLEATAPKVPSVVDIWPAANWFEREAFDLFGIHYENHPDLRRILTDYGFIGHPFRKDFPLVGNVEVRYDAKEGRVLYEPVSIQPRVLEPKVIRTDSRYEVTK